MIKKAYAKINITLNVLGKLDNGYHDLKMIMTPICFFDELEFFESDSDIVECDIDIPPKENIVLKTIKQFKKDVGVNKNVRIILRKKIPIGAGLAGGSADAAATLRGLNEMWRLKLCDDELANIGLKIGADVPFCIYNQTAVVSGVGDEVRSINSLQCYVLLVFPGEVVLTKDVFSKTIPEDMKEKSVNEIIDAISKNNIDFVRENAFNDLQSITIENYKRCKDVFNEIALVDDCFTMTGTGSTFFSLYESIEEAEKVLIQLENLGIKALITRTHP